MPNTQGGLTSQEIINLLNSDFEFAVNFIIDNNPSAVESNISSLSIPLPQNPSNLQMREVIDSLLQDGQDPNAVEKVGEILHVPYIDTAKNYTAGFGSYLQSQMPVTPDGMSQSATLAIMGAISGILSVAGNIWGAYKEEDIAEIHAQMQQDQIAFELDKIERTKVLGIPQTVFIAIIGFFAVMVIVLFLSKK